MPPKTLIPTPSQGPLSQAPAQGKPLELFHPLWALQLCIDTHSFYQVMQLEAFSQWIFKRCLPKTPPPQDTLVMLSVLAHTYQVWGHEACGGRSAQQMYCMQGCLQRCPLSCRHSHQCGVQWRPQRGSGNAVSQRVGTDLWQQTRPDQMIDTAGGHLQHAVW